MNHDTNSPPPISFRLGETVPWPSCPDGYGQVGELLRSNVIVLYLRGGRLCRAKVPAERLARICRESPLLPSLPDNPFRRGIVRPHSKRFETRIANRR